MRIVFVFLGWVLIVILFLGVIIIGAVVWKKKSRQKRDALWIQLANEIGAEFIKGQSFVSSKVQAHFKEWTITLDTYITSGSGSRLYTRIKAPFENTDGLQFTLFPKSLFDNLVTAIGVSVIETGNAEFDHDFIIRGKDELKIQAVFANTSIRQLIEGLRPLELRILQDDLIFQVPGEIKDVERLKSLFELFKETLNQLKG